MAHPCFHYPKVMRFRICKWNTLQKYPHELENCAKTPKMRALLSGLTCTTSCPLKTKTHPIDSWLAYTVDDVLQSEDHFGFAPVPCSFQSAIKPRNFPVKKFHHHFIHMQFTDKTICHFGYLLTYYCSNIKYTVIMAKDLKTAIRERNYLRTFFKRV